MDHGHHGPDRSWRTAISATLHCLTGCAIGEVLGMVLATWWGWSSWPSVALAFALAFVFGYALTFSSVRRHGVSVRAGLAETLFWGTLGASLAIAFVVTVPVNRALIARGRGHAVVHAMHQS
jgi:hypothetical protein